MKRIAIAEDNPELRRNLGQIIQLLGDMQLVLSAGDGQEIVERIDTEQHKPDVVLMDIEMPGIDGIKATHAIKTKWPEIKVIMLTVFDQHNKIFEALKHGADGYLLKGEKPSVILDAIEEVMENKMPMSPRIAQATLAYFRSLPIEDDQKSPEDYTLTPREVEILELIVSGIPYKLVADELHISAKTVRSHSDNIYKKLGVHSKMEAGNLARKNQWFT